MPDYDLTRLGSRAFEQLVVSLSRKEFGPGVQVFGDGPDGGREATFEGSISWSATALGSTAPHDQWNGYTVLQAKFMLKPKSGAHANAVWLQGQIREEIAGWVEAKKANKRTRYPDYLVFVTNVDLSAVARAGGIDKVEAQVRQLIGPGSEAQKAGLHVRGFRIWHGDQIRTMIDAHQDVRWAFDGLLTLGDVLAALATQRPELGTLAINDPLRQDLVSGLRADRWVRLSQAGGSGDSKLWLDDVVVDLPAIVDETADTVRAVGHVLERGDTVLRPRQADRAGSPGVVLIGGPGQGKTTLSQLLAQAYRASMLETADLAPAARDIVEATTAALTRLGLTLPANRRWPVRVDLAKYAEHLSTGADTSLLRWISTQVSARSVHEVTASQLHTWLRICPWALILDGLDEVPSARARTQLYRQLEDFTTQAEDLDADLLVVVTTRPTGYDERLPAPWFEHLNLRPMPAAESAQFAQRLTAKRFDEDPEMREQVSARMAKAAADPTTARLMETPLQVTVMSLIVEKFPTLPSERYTLFDLYYQTMFDREVGKEIVVSRFLSDHRQHIDGVHERVGLVLQVQSESAEHAEAVLGTEELQNLTTELLQHRGYDREKAEDTAAKLVEAALNRLVLLVPREAGLGFEIRTLQELMAARAISEGPDEKVLDRLRLLADHPHWRNTWLLAAGRLLTLSTRFDHLIANLLKHLPDDQGSVGRRLSSGPSLAAALLEDGLAAHRPGLERGLLGVLLTVLDQPPAGDLRGPATAIARLLTGPFRATVLDRLTATATSDATHRATTATILDLTGLLVDSRATREVIIRLRERMTLTEPEQQALNRFLPDHPLPLGPHGRHRVVDAVLRAAVSSGLTAGEQKALADGLAALGESAYDVSGEPPVAYLTHYNGIEPLLILNVVADPDLAVALELALDSFPPGHWTIPALVTRVVWTARHRTPVGDHVMAAVLAEAAAAAPH